MVDVIMPVLRLMPLLKLLLSAGCALIASNEAVCVDGTCYAIIIIRGAVENMGKSIVMIVVMICQSSEEKLTTRPSFVTL